MQPQNPYQPGQSIQPQTSAPSTQATPQTPSARPLYPGYQQPQQPIDYSFITDGGGSSRRPRKFAKLPSLKLILGVVIGLIVLSVGAGAAVTLSRKPDPSITGLTSLAQQQTEMMRVATAASTQSGIADSTQIDAQLVLLSLQTDQTNLLSYLAQNGHKLTAATLGLGRSAATDTTLAAAASAGNYDDAYASVLRNQLSRYQQTLVATRSVVGPKGQQLLDTESAHSKLIAQQVGLGTGN